MGSNPSGGKPQPAEVRSKIHPPVRTERREGERESVDTRVWEVVKKDSKNRNQKQQKEEERNK